jgi:tetratricopeptide (TPR) repeat protein
MLELQDDYSKEGIEKYNKMRDQVIAEFDKALPYFKQAEQIAPDDVNTLIALKEIYAKKDDIEMSNVFKDRLEKVQAGEEVESYFKNN